MSRSGAVLEQDFQQALRLEVTRSLGGRVRLWRQPAGRFETKRGGWIDAAPVGAADLTGVISGTGVRLEVEAKGATTRVRPEQTQWQESMRAHGVVALQVRYDSAVPFDGNVVLACAEIARAIELAECLHPDESLFSHPKGGVWCTSCGWRNGGRARESVL